MPRFFALLLLLGLSECSDSTPAVCNAYVVPKETDLTKPEVSLRNDVIPITKPSCGLSTSCHGTPNGTRHFLGSTDSNVGSDPVTIRTSMVNVPSHDHLTMMI